MDAFKAYDIRGVYGKEVTSALAGKVASWYANLFSVDSAVIGHDVRLSSPTMHKAAIKGLVNQGCDVVDIGLTTTPSISFYLIKEKVSGGIMITASHNPPEHNGMKLYRGRGLDLTYDAGLKDIEASLKKKLPKGQRGTVRKEDYYDDYKEHLLSLSNIHSSLSVAIDAGNGACSKIGPDVFSQLGFSVNRIFCAYDGRFPNHQPDPSDEKNLSVLKDTVKKKSLDLGIAYDGDGDRGTFVDDKGNYVRSDDILRALVKRFAKKGDKIVYSLNCSMALKDEINDAGATPIETRIGRSFIKSTMMKNKAILGGEMSGHLFFRENSYLDDGVVASLKVAEIAAEEKLSSLIGKTKYVSTPDMRIDCKNKFEVVEKAKVELAKISQITIIDGVKAVFDDGWALVRASNTEEKITVRFEAVGKKELDSITRTVNGIIQRHMK